MAKAKATGSTKGTKASAPRATAPKANAGENTQAKSGSFIVWLKNRTYINDTQRVEAGLYIVDSVPARFSKLNSAHCEVFESEVPSRKLAVIARWAGINPDGVEDDEILEKLLSTEFKPF